LQCYRYLTDCKICKRISTILNRMIACSLTSSALIAIKILNDADTTARFRIRRRAGWASWARPPLDVWGGQGLLSVRPDQCPRSSAAPARSSERSVPASVKLRWRNARPNKLGNHQTRQVFLGKATLSLSMSFSLVIVSCNGEIRTRA
jgi:hypothetical protein